MNMKGRFKAAALHLLFSLAMLAGFLWVVIGQWYPGPLLWLQGGDRLVLLLIAIHLIIGPGLVFAICARHKSRRHLGMDIGIITALQIAALAFAGWALHSQRPVLMVVMHDRVLPLPHQEIVGQEPLLQGLTLDADGRHWGHLPLARPLDALDEVFFRLMTEAPQMARDPQQLQPLATAGSQLGRHALGAGLAAEWLDEPDIAPILAARGLHFQDVWLLPFIGKARQGLAVIDRQTGQPLALLRGPSHPR